MFGDERAKKIRHPESASISKHSRVVFAHQLRGIAALLVLVSHYLGVFFDAPKIVASATYSPALVMAQPAWVEVIISRHIFYGPVGVALFFIISGFVIPFSLKRLSIKSFLIGRCMRIFPTYWVCFSLSLSIIWLSSLYWSSSIELSPAHVLSNYLLVQSYMGLPSIDLVNWTLSVEFKFYVLASLTLPWFFKHTTRYCVFISSSTVLANFLVSCVFPDWKLNSFLLNIFNAAAIEGMYLPFILIGVLFYMHEQRQIPIRSFMVCAVVLMVGFGLSWALGPQKEGFPVAPFQYTFALFLFTFAYLYKEKFKPFLFLDFLADISYPLYAVHGITGYVVMRITLDLGFNFAISFFAALATAVFLAIIIHKLIEVPSNKLGKSWLK